MLGSLGSACVALAMAADTGAAPLERNGFALEPSSIDSSEILPGGPPRDGIPALDHPPHTEPGAAPWRGDERVIGLELGGEARAYPISLLNWHELVNDTLGGEPILVTYCPLCATGIVFDRRVAGSVRRFGVSGLLFRSDLLLYDRESESLWSQISFEAITGPSLGRRLGLVRSEMTSWEAWRRRHPHTTVLTRDTGHRRDYGRTPYQGYASSSRVLFPVPEDARYHPKTPTVGLRAPSGAARAYPADEVRRAGGSVAERFEGRDVRVAWDAGPRSFSIEVPAEIEVVEGFWFAWAAFHPETSVFTAPAREREGMGAAKNRHQLEETSP